MARHQLDRPSAERVEAGLHAVGIGLERHQRLVDAHRLAKLAEGREDLPVDAHLRGHLAHPTDRVPLPGREARARPREAEEPVRLEVEETVGLELVEPGQEARPAVRPEDVGVVVGRADRHPAVLPDHVTIPAHAFDVVDLAAPFRVAPRQVHQDAVEAVAPLQEHQGGGEGLAVVPDVDRVSAGPQEVVAEGELAHHRDAVRRPVPHRHRHPLPRSHLEPEDATGRPGRVAARSSPWPAGKRPGRVTGSFPPIGASPQSARAAAASGASPSS